MTEKLHVGIVTPHYPSNPTGGGAVSTRLLVDTLLSRDQIENVSVYTFDGGQDSRGGSLTIRRFDPPTNRIAELSNAYAWFKLNWEPSVQSVDIIHSYNMTLHPSVGWVSNKFGVPAVATLNSYAYVPNDAVGISLNNPYEIYKRISQSTTGKLLTRGMRNIKRFIALSTPVKRIYEENLLPDSNIEVVPNMYNPDFSPSGMNIPDWSESLSNKTKLLYVGSLRETKGVEYLVRSMAELPDKYHLLIAGSGGQEEKLQALTEERGLSNRITFLGQVPYDSVPNLYSTADIFVHPGIWPEPFGRTTLEAMQSGLPVVATNKGGPAEVIPQSELLCEPRNPRNLAEKIEIARENYNEISKTNLQAVEKYSPSSVVPQIISIYDSVLHT